METKFTKGPWDREGTTVFALDETGTVNRFSFNVQGGFECRRQGWEPAVRTSDEELEAVAALSASSPDLYTVAERALSYLAPIAGGDPDGADLIGALSTVLARARGETA